MKLLSVFLGLFVSLAANAAQPDSVNVFIYHNGSPKDGVKVAYSVDGRQWMTVGDGFSVVKSDYGAWGSDKSMYGVSALYDNGRLYAVWEVNEKEPQFATTFSDDLFLWKPQDYPYAKGVEGVKEPLLTKSNGLFCVSLRTGKGDCYRMTSKDFVSWSAPEKIAKAVYDGVKRETTVTLNGREVRGEKFRAPYGLIDNLRCRINDYNLRNQRCNERAAGDGDRFKGLDRIKASFAVDFSRTKKISDHLMGVFFEDINYAADGGLYAELVQNRDFEYSASDRGEWNAMSYWDVKGDGVKVDISTDNPIHKNNPHYAVIKTERVGGGIQNRGFSGIVVGKGEKYDLSLFLKKMDGKSGRVSVKLMDGEKVIASASFGVGSGPNWKRVKAVLTAKESAEKAVLLIEPQQQGSVGVDFVSLFPQKTFKNRKNGLRADLAQTIADLKPRFVRFPGGCVSHGNGLENMYRWKETIGELWERKPQFNLWGYHQSKGIGFYEYFLFCEDIGAEPLPVLPAGVPCQNSSRGGKGQQGGVPMSEMESYTQELLDLIEWANGDAKTSPLAALRAKAGHPKPFNLKMIGVGNEDIIGDVFKERFNFINRRIKERYPDIQVVGTVGPFNEGADYEFGWRLAKEENIDIVDEHYYVQPGWFLHNQDFYDRYDRNGTKVYLGEWASWGNAVENAVAEALHLTNVERNADVVTMASYAPLLAKRGNTQWNTDLIYFTNTTVEPSVNYYVQKLFGENAGDEYIYSDLGLDIDGKYLANVSKRISKSVVRDSKTGDIIIKLVNMTNVPADIDISLGDLSGYNTTADLTVLAGNYADKDTKPQTSTITVAEKFQHTLPAYSLTVVRVLAQLVH